MPVQLQVSTQLRASENKQAFEAKLSRDLSQGNVDGKQKLNDLREYLKSKNDNAQIRVVNTTRNADLAFQFKSFGYQAYRQERTAGALTQLLVHAGVNPEVARTVVDGVLKENGNYITATKGLVSSILNHEQIQDCLSTPATALALKSTAAHDSDGMDHSPPSKLSKKDIFALIKNEYAYAQNFERDHQYSEKSLQAKFIHKTGCKAEFYTQKVPPVISIENGAMRNEAAIVSYDRRTAPEFRMTAAKYLLRQTVDGQAVGKPFLVPRDDLLKNRKFENRNFEVLGVISSKSPIDGITSIQQLDEFLNANGMQVGGQLGSGSFGSVKSVTTGPDNTQQVVKYFANKNNALRPVTLTSARSTAAYSEGYAAYLVKSRDQQWVKPHVVAPSHYLVGLPSANEDGSTELKLIATSDLKKVIRDNAEKGNGDLKCYGLVMDKAPGSEVGKIMHKLKPVQKVTLTQSGLSTLRSLNSRGFVHRDIKPQNLTFDGQKLSFIDTGLLFKIRKTDADKGELQDGLDPIAADANRNAQLPSGTLGTWLYKHKELFPGGKQRIGTQADLHAMGLITLQIEDPYVFHEIFKQFSKEIKKNRTDNMPLTPEKFLFLLDEIIKSTETKNDIRQAATTLKTNMEDASHLANLGLQCLQMADTSNPGFSAAKWADRQFSDQHYAQLLNHPSLAVANAVMA